MLLRDFERVSEVFVPGSPVASIYSICVEEASIVLSIPLVATQDVTTPFGRGFEVCSIYTGERALDKQSVFREKIVNV